MIANSPSLTLMSAVVRHSLSGFNFQSQIMQDIYLILSAPSDLATALFIYRISAKETSIPFLNLQIVANSNSCRKFTCIRHSFLKKLFKGGNYSRAETNCRNTACIWQKILW